MPTDSYSAWWPVDFDTDPAVGRNWQVPEGGRHQVAGGIAGEEWPFRDDLVLFEESVLAEADSTD